METWKPAPNRPGYRCKTIQRGPATITIYRPILSETEDAQAKAQAKKVLESAMRDYYRRISRERARAAML